MIKLPENKPRELQPTHNIKLFLYGEPYTGKTTFASKFPNPLILSTDGNYKFLTTPALDVNNLTDWKELIDVLGRNFRVLHQTGVRINPFTRRFRFSRSLSVNYMMVFERA